MKPSTQWTDTERLAICEVIGIEMLERRNTKNWVNIEDVLEWAERLISVTCMPKEYLEASRPRVLTGHPISRRIDDD